MKEDFISLNDIATVPTESGVYRFYDKTKQLLYVGKAVHLKKRVKSYFNKKHEDVKTRLLASKICFITVIVTRSEAEALLLEKQLIQQLKPPYNILLKDDKYFPYLKLTKDYFPRLQVVRKKVADQATYFGPFPSVGSTKSLMKHLLTLFPIRDCKQVIHQHKKDPDCMLLHTQQCIGPCVNKHCKEEYDRLISQLSLFLRGKNKRLLSELKQDMLAYSEAQDYERAAKTRDCLQQLSSLFDQKRMFSDLHDSFMCVAFSKQGPVCYLTVQRYIHGKLFYQQGNYVLETQDINCFIEQVMLQVLEDQTIEMAYILCQENYLKTITYCCQLAQGNLSCVAPQKGSKKKALDLAEKNAAMAAVRLYPKQSSATLLNNCQDLLQLTQVPIRIFGFDVSHLGGTDIVGSAVCFVDGKACKDQYRHFKIKTPLQQSHDPLCIKELIIRRIELCLEKKEPLPNLILVDGGKGQLRFAYDALCELKLETDIDLLALAKKQEQLFCMAHKQPFELGSDSPVRHLMQQIRDESHRFALRLQRKQRDKRIT